MLTLEEKKFVVQQWNITGSWIAIRRAFLKRPEYHAKNLPALSSLKLFVNKSRRLQISRWKASNILRLRSMKKAYKSRVRMLLQRDSVRPELQLPDIYSLTRLSYPKRGL